MEVLLTKHPNITNIHCKSVNDYYSRFIESADKLKIAKGLGITVDELIRQ